MIASIKVHDIDGNPVDLIQKYSGKPLLLILYNNDCLGCTGSAILNPSSDRKEALKIGLCMQLKSYYQDKLQKIN
jgi:hypothetical protein